MTKIPMLIGSAELPTDFFSGQLTAADICRPSRCIDIDTTNCDVFAIFDANPAIDSLPVVDHKKIVGLINRERFMGRMAGRFHWEIYSKKRCSKMMDLDPLVIDAATLISEVATQLLGGGARHLLPESFIVARAGIYLGTAYSSDVLTILLKREQLVSRELRQHQDQLSELVEVRTRDLLKAKEEAEQANQAKTEFLSNISHELRTPLHAILAFCKIGVQRFADAPREKLGQYFENINTGGQRLSRLVNDLLDLSKLDAGKMEMYFAPTDLYVLATEVVAELSSLAAQRGIELSLETQIGSLMLSCDRNRIHQVLVNVLSNAIKFSPEATSVRVCFEVQAENQGVLVQVIDQGPGIPDTELESIFERFTQSSKTRTGAGGTGLGLPISMQIMRLHNGSIRAANHPAGGACFTLSFPPG